MPISKGEAMTVSVFYIPVITVSGDGYAVNLFALEWGIPYAMEYLEYIYYSRRLQLAFRYY